MAFVFPTEIQAFKFPPGSRCCQSRSWDFCKSALPLFWGNVFQSVFNPTPTVPGQRHPKSRLPKTGQAVIRDVVPRILECPPHPKKVARLSACACLHTCAPAHCLRPRESRHATSPRGDTGPKECGPRVRRSLSCSYSPQPAGIASKEKGQRRGELARPSCPPYTFRLLFLLFTLIVPPRRRCFFFFLLSHLRIFRFFKNPFCGSDCL